MNATDLKLVGNAHPTVDQRFRRFPNADHPEERRRWSLAHGYLHFLAHRRKPVLDFEGQYKRMPESERLAEAFPKYFLMPTSGLLKRFNDMYRANGKFTPTFFLTPVAS
ncbi:MAG: ImmA/IrrE family metallo-endopeptidase [Coleofasciculus sp. C2-GNP5-27]